MEPVAPNALFGEPARQREGGSDLRLGMVKRRIETGDLRQGRVQLRDRRDGGEMMRLMQRSERNEASQFGNDLSVDPYRPL